MRQRWRKQRARCLSTSSKQSSERKSSGCGSGNGMESESRRRAYRLSFTRLATLSAKLDDQRGRFYQLAVQRGRAAHGEFSRSWPTLTATKYPQSLKTGRRFDRRRKRVHEFRLHVHRRYVYAYLHQGRNVHVLLSDPSARNAWNSCGARGRDSVSEDTGTVRRRGC